MHVMKNFFLLTIIGLILVSCQADPEPEKQQGTDEQTTDVDNQTTDFEGNDFTDQGDLELLKELNICALNDSMSIVADCSPDNFKLVPIFPDKPKKDGFLLLVKSGIVLKGETRPLPPVRHIYAFVRENGELVKVNGFRGDLIASRKGEKGNDIVLALYLKEDETLFHCLYKWDGEHYSFESIEGLDWGEGVKTLKADMKDSVSNEVYNSIMASNLIF